MPITSDFVTRSIFVAVFLSVVPAAPRPIMAQNDPAPPLPPHKEFTNDLPLERPEGGVEVHGYPALDIERLEIVALLVEGRIEELEARFTDLRDRSLDDIRWEEHVVEAYWAFRRPDPEFGALIQAWMDSLPGSAAAHIAFAKHAMARASTLQDGRAAANIPEDELDLMRAFVSRADQEVDLALALDPQNLAAHTMKLEVLPLSGSSEETTVAIQTALGTFPTSFAIRRQVMWNASRFARENAEFMDALVEDAETRLAENPRFRVIRGLAHSLIADRARTQGRYAEAVQMQDSALTFGDDATIFLNRARAYYGAGDYVRALEDIDRSAKLNPQNMGMLQLRAETLSRIGPMVPRDSRIGVGNHLYRDLERLVALQPENEWAVDALATVASSGLDDPNVFTIVGRTVGDVYTMLDQYGVFPSLIVVLGGLAGNLLLWRRGGYWMPRYVHGLALLALGMMLWINWLWVQAGGVMWTRRYVLIAVVPGLVYFTFVTRGGLRAALRRREESQAHSRSSAGARPSGRPATPALHSHESDLRCRGHDRRAHN